MSLAGVARWSRPLGGYHLRPINSLVAGSFSSYYASVARHQGASGKQGVRHGGGGGVDATKAGREGRGDTRAAAAGVPSRVGGGRAAHRPGVGGAGATGGHCARAMAAAGTIPRQDQGLLRGVLRERDPSVRGQGRQSHLRGEGEGARRYYKCCMAPCMWRWQEMGCAQSNAALGCASESRLALLRCPVLSVYPGHGTVRPHWGIARKGCTGFRA
eukprot:ctg_4322.g556